MSEDTSYREAVEKLANSPPSAFPWQYRDDTNVLIHKGLTRRQWFAGLAMQQLFTQIPTKGLGVPDYKAIAEAAYLMADAMMKEGSNWDGV